MTRQMPEWRSGAVGRRPWISAWLLICICCAGLLCSACQSMAPSPPEDQQRQLDHLLALMDLRLQVAEGVAQAKWNSGAPIDDPVRERQILDALSAGLPSTDPAYHALVRRFFQDQFDAGKIIQRSRHAQWRQQHLGAFAQPPDLARDIRPALDRLTPPLLAALAQVHALLRQDRVRIYLQQRSAVLLTAASDPAVRETALSALLSMPDAH